MENDVRKILEAVYREESRRVLSTLIRLLGDFDAAEDALHDAFQAALEQWPQEGVPANPRAWLVSAGRFKGIDRLRRTTRFEAPLDSGDIPELDKASDSVDDRSVQDDQLRLIFTCCHPALAPEARIALTLREVCGLGTEEIARAFLTTATTLAQRIVRAKSKIREALIPYEVPSRADLADRLDTVLQVIYLVFNEGYSASAGDALTRPDLSGEAIRLGRLLRDLLPEPEVSGLLALMLLHESRRPARTSPQGDLILLEQQDRTLWNRDLIEEGQKLVEHTLSGRQFGPYTLQAAIAAAHSEADSADRTDWVKITALYTLLLQSNPSPIVELNRAVALAMRDGPAAGLAVVDDILARGELDDYYLVHSARADLCRRLGKKEEAKDSYRQALALAKQLPERRYLEGRLKELA